MLSRDSLLYSALFMISFEDYCWNSKFNLDIYRRPSFDFLQLEALICNDSGEAEIQVYI